MEKSNKLIAEFMGWDIQSPTTIPNNLHLSNLELDNGEVMELKFDTSWDWLMPVISKCFEVRGSHYIESIYHSLDAQDLSFAHESVVNFIKENNDGKDK